MEKIDAGSFGFIAFFSADEANDFVDEIKKNYGQDVILERREEFGKHFVYYELPMPGKPIRERQFDDE